MSGTTIIAQDLTSLITIGSLMEVESIRAFCNTFDLHKRQYALKTNFRSFSVTVLHRLYCTWRPLESEHISGTAYLLLGLYSNSHARWCIRGVRLLSTRRYKKVVYFCQSKR